MVDDTNEWIKTDEAQAKLDRLARRLTHSAAKSNELIESLSPTQQGHGGLSFFRQTSDGSTMSSVDIAESARIAGGLMGTINERN